VATRSQPPECDHKFVYLREETRPTRTFDGRVLARTVLDLYFCERCLTYRERPLRDEEPSRRDLGWETVRRY
jgi:hypothetical protein